MPRKKVHNNAIERIKQARKNNPITLEKKHLLKAVNCVLKNRDQKKLEHRMVQDYGEHGAYKARVACLCPSTDLVCKIYDVQRLHCNAKELLWELRKAILMHNWPYCTRLIILLLENKQSNRNTLVSLTRTCLTILFNMNKSPEVIKEFCTVCLGISEESKIKQYIKQCFEMPPKLTLTLRLQRQVKKRKMLNE